MALSRLVSFNIPFFSTEKRNSYFYFERPLSGPLSFYYAQYSGLKKRYKSILVTYSIHVNTNVTATYKAGYVVTDTHEDSMVWPWP